MPITNEPCISIQVLIPVRLPDDWRATAIDRYRAYADPRVCIEGADLSQEQQRRADEGALVEVLLENAQRAERQGASACIIDCFGDPGLTELSASVGCPVVGVGHAGMHYAYGVASRFSVITSEQAVVSEIEANAERYGFSSRLVQVVSIDIPAAELPGRRAEAVDRLKDATAKLSGGCDLVVLGCTELATLGAEVKAGMGPDGSLPALVNPIAAAVGLTQTRIALS